MDLRLSYREERFTPSEAAAMTGLSLTLKRDWRSQGHLKARESGRASFSPRELAEMRVMMKLRSLGLPLPESRRIAEEAATSVVFAALPNHRDKTLTVEAAPDRAAAYIDRLERETNGGYLGAMADLGGVEALYRHALLEGGRGILLRTLDDDVMEGVEAAGLVNLWAVAAAIAEAAPRPLFTLIVPASLRSLAQA